ACDATLGPGSWNGLCAGCVNMSRQHEQIIDGYQILRPLGKGAMGIVYLAIRQADGSLVALKTIIPQVAGTPNQVERFLREAEILRQLTHTNIVSFRESGES